jgi:hypothetical protein
MKCQGINESGFIEEEAVMSYEDFRLRFQAKDAEFSYYRELDQLIVDARDSSVTDDDIAALAEFPNLIYLNLAGTQVTNRVLSSISRCTRLEFLDLGHTRCDDICLESLVGFTELGGIGLSGIALTDRVMVLGQLKKLSMLELSGTGVLKNVVRALLQTTALSDVNLAGNGLSPGDFADLEVLDDNSRLVFLMFDDGDRLALERPPIEERG